MTMEGKIDSFFFDKKKCPLQEFALLTQSASNWIKWALLYSLFHTPKEVPPLEYEKVSTIVPTTGIEPVTLAPLARDSAN